MRDDALRQQLLTDPHSPGMVRAFVPLVNNDAFVAAWNVKPGDRVQFVALLLPHAPAADATPLAGAVRVLRDEPGLAAVALADPGGRWELAVLNATGQRLTLASPRGDVTTDAPRPRRRLRRDEAKPVILAKYKRHLGPHLPEARVKELVELSQDSKKLESMSVDEYVDLYTVKESKFL